MKKIVKAKYKFERLDLTRDEALEMFKENKFKTHMIETKIPPGSLTSVYRIGEFVDLCTGPHISNTGMMISVKLLKNSSTYWLGDAKNDSL